MYLKVGFGAIDSMRIKGDVWLGDKTVGLKKPFQTLGEEQFLFEQTNFDSYSSTLSILWLKFYFYMIIFFIIINNF